MIYGASIGRPIGKTCKVQMNYMDGNDRRRTYTRSVNSATSSEYRIDGKIVSPPVYRQALKDININIKARNFLVYQGAVEQIAIRSPKELTEMFEELSKYCLKIV